MTIITVNGLNFGIESDGWAGHDGDRDLAVAHLERNLGQVPLAALRQLHAGLKAGIGAALAAGNDLCYEASSGVTVDWHDPSSPALFLSAR